MTSRHANLRRHCVYPSRQVVQVHQAKKKKVLKHSEDALCAVLAALSQVFIRSVTAAAGAEGADADLASTGGKARALLEEQCATFVREISAANAQFLDVKPAVRGLAAMAPSIAYLATGKAGGGSSGSSSGSSSSSRSKNSSGGLGLVTQVVLALKRAAEHDVDGSACVRPSASGVLSLGVHAMHHAAVYLHAIASVLHACPPAAGAAPPAAVAVGPDLLAYLARTSVDLVVVFPRMKLLHQPVVSSALCLLLKVRLIQPLPHPSTSSLYQACCSRCALPRPYRILIQPLPHPSTSHFILPAAQGTTHAHLDTARQLML